MIGAGQLTRRVVVQRFTSTTNALNEPVKTWQDFISYRAQRKDVSDGEKYAAGQVGASQIARFLIRSTNDSRTITPIDRLSHEGTIWEITGVKEADQGRNRFIEITATRRSEP
ncbi:phage head-tail adaptor, putative, SPP1 family [Phyllobacterium sp. YR620]|uniref:phage head closure protein n=1 Tax=Phyllobacterium sp. YR620 TaxID=1881066 RepID=UPI0008910540|nr:phage head closure protein [Phyllobacterium sp. YR620]SDP92478.1 phage head-tail adaptor, putative, SPP1 family [Phyllobacterium sp. YR620]